MPISAAIALQKGSEFLPLFNHNLKKLVESGIIYKLDREMGLPYPKCSMNANIKCPIFLLFTIQMAPKFSHFQCDQQKVKYGCVTCASGIASKLELATTTWMTCPMNLAGRSELTGSQIKHKQKQKRRVDTSHSVQGLSALSFSCLTAQTVMTSSALTLYFRTLSCF